VSASVEKVAVGTDGSATAAKAVEFAVEMAERYGAKLVAISCYRPVPEDRLRKEQRNAPQELVWSINPMEDVEATLREVEEKARERGIGFFCEARQGDPADVLCAIAAEQGADVLVVGSRGMDRRLRGSVPNTVSHNAPCSVLIVKTD
jgi:nucleotide-binding universal stress UspA family protein